MNVSLAGFTGSAGDVKLKFTLNNAGTGNVAVVVDTNAPVSADITSPATTDVGMLQPGIHTFNVSIIILSAVGGSADLKVEITSNGNDLHAYSNNTPPGNPFTISALPAGGATSSFSFGVSLV